MGKKQKNVPINKTFYQDYDKFYISTYKPISKPILWNYITNKNNEKIHKLFLKYKKYIRGRCLEIGCAPAKYLIYFKRVFDCDVFGIDNSYEGTLVSKKNLKVSKVNGNIIMASCLNLPFREETFDVIVSFGLIEHFTDPKLLLSYFYKILKPNGILITYVPNMVIGLRYFYELLFDKQNLDGHQKISKKFLYKAYKELNFKNIYAIYSGIWIWVYLPLLRRFFRYNMGENYIPDFLLNRFFITRFNSKEVICIGIK
ncbi:MAG: class I SAM-dependent methyltransferase [Promethearchaeota archaeon]